MKENVGEKVGEAMDNLKIHTRLEPLHEWWDKTECEKDEVKLVVPSYRQLDRYSCGAVGAWSIVKTFHPKANFHDFYADCRITAEGSDDHQIIWALRRHRVGVSVRDRMSFEDIKKTIDQKLPILTGIDEGNGPHWVCIYGYGLEPRRIFSCNHTGLRRGRKVTGWKEWKTVWGNDSMNLVCWGK